MAWRRVGGSCSALLPPVLPLLCRLAGSTSSSSGKEVLGEEVKLGQEFQPNLIPSTPPSAGRPGTWVLKYLSSANA